MNVIVAVDSNWGIGYNGTQQVVIPADRKHFREITAGGIVIVGRRTLEDFPGGLPLKNRINIIFTKNSEYTMEGAVVVHDLSELSEALKDYNSEKVFVIGGDSIFKMLLPYCRYAYITKIEAAPAADRFFPNLDEDPSWVIERSEPEQEFEGIKFTFVRYENRTPLELA